MQEFVKFLNQQSGATAIEYGLIASGISIVIIAGTLAAGGSLSGMFLAISAAVASVAP